MKGLALLAITISALAGHLTRGAQPPASTSTVATPSTEGDHSDCAGGAEEVVTARLAPTALADGRLTIALDVHHHLEEGAEVIGTIELVDDRGNRVGRTELPARRVAVRRDTSFPYTTPRGLADGYYRVLASLFARGESSRTEDFSSRELYLHVARGELTPVTSAEWLTQSNDGLAFTTP